MTHDSRQFSLFRIAVWSLAGLAALIFLLWLFGKALSPGGSLAVTTNLIDPAPFVSEPMPSERVLLPRTGAAGLEAEIIGDPVYLDYTPPAGFDEVEIALRYRDGIQPDIRLGALVSALDQTYDLRPAGNALLDALPWHHVSSGRYMLWDKGGEYVSFDDFLKNPPPRTQVAAVGRVPLPPYRLSGYRASTAPRKVTLSLRGTHRLIAYVKDETLQFSFSVQDMNRLAGADPVIISVWPEDLSLIHISEPTRPY